MPGFSTSIALTTSPNNLGFDVTIFTTSSDFPVVLRSPALKSFSILFIILFKYDMNLTLYAPETKSSVFGIPLLCIVMDTLLLAQKFEGGVIGLNRKLLRFHTKF